MQTRFLSTFGDLKNTAIHPKGLWLVHADEPLTKQWLIDALNTHWHNHHQQSKRFELISAHSWQEIINELNTLSLFGEDLALIVTGNHKPDQKTIQALHKFAQDVQQGHSNNHLLWCLPKQDKKSLNHKAVKLFDEMGLVIDANVYNEQIRSDILTAKANELGLTLSHEAWQLLLSHTEHNLLTAFQTLWRASYAYQPNQTIDTNELADILVEGSQFDVFALSDNLLYGNLNKSLQILYQLRHTDITPSLVLWAMSKDARLIGQIQAGKDPQTLGIWQSKIHLYQQAAMRTSQFSHTWAKQIYNIDKAIKGMGQHNPWQLIQDLAISLCGVGQINTTAYPHV